MFTRLRSSLRYKISAQMLLLSLVPLTIVGAVVFIVLSNQLGRFSDRLVETEGALRSDVVGANLAGVADALAAEIDAYLLERIKDVRRWSDTPELIEVVRHANRIAIARGLATADVSFVQAALDAQAEQGGSPFFLAPDEQAQPDVADAISVLFNLQERSRGTFVEIILTEATGINALITRPLSERVHRDALWWRQASQQGVAGIGVVDAHLDEGGQRVVLGIALPVIDPDRKEVLGVIQGTVDLTEVQLLVSRRAALIPGGEAQVFTSDSGLLADTTSQNDLGSLLDSDSSQRGPARVISENESVPGFEVLESGFTEETLIVGYSRTGGGEFYDQRAGLSGFSGFEWGITVSQPEETALQVLNPLLDVRETLEQQSGFIRSIIVIAAGLTAAVGLIVALLLARGIANPLVSLSRMVERVREGDYNVQSAVTSEDEVGMLQDTFNLMVSGLAERERMRDLFGRAVSPEVAALFMQGQVELGGETRQVTVLFSDIRGFTSLSEPLPPGQVITFVNEWLNEMHQAIQGVGGIVHKLAGDSIMALFGVPVADPNSPQAAMRAAIRMRTRLKSLNERRRARGDVPLRIGVGINTGPVVAGGVGSEDRLEYTVLGDAVNVTARLESLTKDFPEYDILISGATLKALPQADKIETVDLGEVQVKGKTEPVRVFAVLDYQSIQV